MSQPSRPFDLVALDLDGTILDKRFESGFSPNVVETIARVQAAGVPVTELPRRNVLGYVREAAQRLAIQLPVVTTQGAVVAHPRTGEVIFEALLPADLALAVAAWVDQSGPVTALYLSDGHGGAHIYQNREEDAPEFYDHWLGAPRQIHTGFHELLRNGRAHRV
ncbi:MAG: HAD hydrolase family protein [Caldilineaceae bacterium]